MVYIDNLSEFVYIPRHNNETSEAYSVELTSRIHTDSINLVENQENVSDTPLYYKLRLAMVLSSIPTGEYEYTLYGDFGEVLEKGLLTFGDYRPEWKPGYTFDPYFNRKRQYND